MFCIRCSKLQNVIPQVTLSKNPISTYAWLPLHHYQHFNFSRYCMISALINQFHVTPTSGKHYSLVPCTCFGPQAWPVMSSGIMLFDYFLCGHTRGIVYQQILQVREQLLPWIMGVHWPQVKWLNYEKGNKFSLRHAQLCIQNGRGYSEQ